MENMGYEQILAEIAVRVAKECELTPSEAVGFVMNNELTGKIIQEIKKGVNVNVEDWVNQYLKDEIM